MRRYGVLLTSFILSTIIAACSIGSRPDMPVMHDFGPIVQQASSDVTITLDAPIWLWDDKIRYRLLYDNPTVIRRYNQDRWETLLPALLERRLAASELRWSGHIQFQLIQFEQQFVTADSAKVVMTLIARVFADSGKLLSERKFSLTQENITPNATGAITGFIALIEQMQIEIQRWLDTLAPVHHK